jgi:hypothetical protein
MTDYDNPRDLSDKERIAAGAPTHEDERHDDLEYNPALEPQRAKAWLNLLLESEKAFERWNEVCDNIDKLYASIDKLSTAVTSTGWRQRDREYQMFWANCEVVKPAIYARPPAPVVVTKFKDRRPVYQSAAELLERCCITSFDIARINEVMLLVRDDVALYGRGVAWCRYESGGKGKYYAHEKVCIDYKNRRDFLHSLSPNWNEVTWVAAASYLTRAEARERFHPYSGDEYQDAEYAVDRDAKEIGGTDNRERAKFWEIWDQQNGRCVWVAHGCEKILDEDDSHLDLQYYFPCPKPAYGSVQRGSLVPVPDALQYMDQINELNTLTAKIHALAEALQMRGFYPGGTEIGDAIQSALAINTPGRVMVPISNWAAFGGSKEVIIWMPIAEVAATLQTAVATRKEIIADIYQIMGLSDIMRGATDPRETAHAQALKTQYGTSRIRDKQQELVRIARDLVCITADIITEKFDDTTIIAMTQTQLPTMRMQKGKIAAIQADMQRAQQMMAQLPPQQMQQQPPQPGETEAASPQQQIQFAMTEAQNEIDKLQNQATFEQVMHLLRDQRARAFILDIETDSTIEIDEQAEKQQRGEFLGMLGQLLPQLFQMVMTEPGMADLAGEILKFGVAPFRVSRSLDGAIDSMIIDQQQKAGMPRRDDPNTIAAKTQLQIEQMKDKRERDKDQADTALKAAELKAKTALQQEKLNNQKAIEAAKLMQNQADSQQAAQQGAVKLLAEREKAQQARNQTAADAALNQQKIAMAERQAQMKQADMAARATERQQAQQFRQQQAAIRGFPGGRTP